MQPQAQAHHHQSYYAVLGVQPGAAAAEIRAAYHRLAMRWHPDKIAGGGHVDPARAEEAKSRFQQIHEAYQVLSDDKRRALYDAGMYDPLDDDQEDVEGFHDFVQEMVSLMAAVEREEPVYSLADLQSMLDGMIRISPRHNLSPAASTPVWHRANRAAESRVLLRHACIPRGSVTPRASAGRLSHDEMMNKLINGIIHPEAHGHGVSSS